ncbi:MAG: hypothetical protein LAT68_12005 [Cyclobacteriaceae bacterium]|nr:hypothetical protein [Cyclobacteriaceae bacterium]MCH8517040.1 hypothetical protein [Cyclobacteriaceae bacterium]
MQSPIYILFQSGNLPAPYAYRFHIESFANHQWKFEKHFVDREELSEEELHAEGFSGDDDYLFEGKLPEIWRDELISLIAKSPIVKDPKKLQNLDHNLFFNYEGEKEQHPANQSLWQYFLEELMQACLETQKFELPFQLFYTEIKEGEKDLTIYLNASFSSKTIIAQRNLGKIKESSVPWKKLEKIFKLISMPDLIEDAVIEQHPNKSGQYISFDGNSWFEFGVGYQEPAVDSNHLMQIESMLKTELW